MKLCIHCGGDLLLGTKEINLLEVDGHKFIAAVPAMRCNKCGEERLDGRSLEQLDLLIAASLADAGSRSGGTFRLMRKALGMSAIRVADLLGVAPETISRWETGKREVDRSTFATLAALIKDAIDGRSTTMSHLQALREPRQLGPTVRLDLVTAA